MSHACSLPLLVACALLVVAVYAAPALPKRSETRGTKMVRDRSIMVKRLPFATYYPLNLWPKPRYPGEIIEESYETFQYRKMIEHMIKVG